MKKNEKSLDKTADNVYNKDKTEWFKCPICGKKLLLISESTHIENLKYKCRRCHNTIDINID